MPNPEALLYKMFPERKKNVVKLMQKEKKGIELNKGQ